MSSEARLRKDRQLGPDIDVRGRSPAVRAVKTAVPALIRRHGAGYGRFVRAMKVILPSVALALIGIVVLWPHLSPQRDQFHIGFADPGVGSDDLSMIHARYFGTDEKNRPYSVSAESVKSLAPGGERMELASPEAEITLEDGAWVSVRANTGEYDVEAKSLDLAGTVTLHHDKGHELHTSQAHVDLENGVVTGSEAVEGHGPVGTLAGQGFVVMDNGNTILLTGRSAMSIYSHALRRE